MTGLNNWKQIRNLGFKDQYELSPSRDDGENALYEEIKEQYTRDIKILQSKLLKWELQNENNLYRN